MPQFRPIFVLLVAAGITPLPARPQSAAVFDPPVAAPHFHAQRTDQPLALDGRLDEPVWQRAIVATEFVQREPVQGAPPAHATEVRIAYDEHALYIGAICHQQRAATRVRNLRRDFELSENDVLGIAIDGFLDRRNAVVFQVTPHGSQSDFEIGAGVEDNLDWDARWSVRTQIADTYWSAEIAIPWRTLRYPAGADRLGLLFARNVRSHNEQLSAPAVPRALESYRMTYAGELRGIALPPPDRNVQLAPYALNSQTRQTATPDRANVEIGGDVKWAITPSTVLDVTLNTDFAQTDVDRRVTNFDRFSVFLPERRQFFLENAGIFSASVTEWITPFFSRRIGLDEAGRPLPLDGGLRLTSRSSTQQLGVLALRQDDVADAATDFAIGRYSRNVAAGSRVGGMLTYRRDTHAGQGDHDRQNITQTIDGLWQPSDFFGVQGMVSLSDDAVTGTGTGAQLYAFWRNDKASVTLLEYYDRDYNPGIGLELLDANYRMHGVTASYQYRSQRLPRSIRSVSPSVSAFVFEDSEDGDLLFGYVTLRPLTVRFHSGALLDLSFEPNRQQLDEPFYPLGIGIEPGRYDYTRYRVFARTDQSAPVAASGSAETGGYFDGRLTTYTATARLAPSPHVELSLDYELNEVRALGRDAVDLSNSLYGFSVRLAWNPRLQLSGLYQWDDAAHESVWNVRVAWEYQPLSYIYLVYNSNTIERSVGSDRFAQQQLIAKVTYRFDL